VVYEPENNKFYHLDSSRQKINREYIKRTVEHMCNAKEAEFKELEVPLQKNADDCGIYMLKFMELLAENPGLLKGEEFPEINSDELRKE